MKEPLRVVAVAPFAPNFSGEANYNTRLLKEVCSEFPDDLELTVFSHLSEEASVDFQILPNLSVRPRTGKGGRVSRTRATLALENEIVATSPDVVHFMAATKPSYGGILGSEVSSLLARRLRKKGIRSVHTIHSFASEKEILDTANLHGLRPPLDRLFLDYARRVYRSSASSPDLLRILACGDDPCAPGQGLQIWGLKPRAWEPEWHPCNPKPVSAEEREAAKADLGLGGEFVVIALGFMEPIKGFHHLLASVDQIVDQHPATSFVIGGDAIREEGRAYGESLQAQLNTIRHPEKVRLKVGFWSGEEWNQVFAAADLVVAAYQWTWGPSGPIHDALGKGKAVIASSVENNRDLADVVELVPPDDPGKLAPAIIKLAENPALRQKLESQAREYAAKHSWKNEATALVETYRRLGGA